MPYANIRITKGATSQQKAEVIKGVTDLLVDVLGKNRATTFVVHQDKTLLHLHRSLKMWLPPGGHIDRDELPHIAALREVKEETGLDIEIRSIISVVSNFLSPGLHTLAIILLARVVGGEARAGDDLQALQWFPLEGQLPEMAFEADQHIIERYSKTRLEGAPVDPDFALTA